MVRLTTLPMEVVRVSHLAGVFPVAADGGDVGLWGQAHLDAVVHPHGLDDETLAAAAASVGTTIYHPVGSTRMGTDPQAVVDPGLRVHGIANLWVIDAGVMPAITSGNTNAPTIMIAEKGAAMILEDARN